ncbi:MAG: ABC transporter substrate-binding protein [Proteobacteria bacterium]|nr:ABC transporter substrate-binding protein [Pseudomonadota bacterium]
MRTRTGGLLIGLAASAIAGSVVVLAAPVVARDPAGHEVRLPAPPTRIVTLLPSLTEDVCALNACGALVATDRYSNWPTEVRALPKAGGLEDIEIEQVVAVHPQVVLLGHVPRVAERLRSLGIPAIELETKGYADIARTLAVVGALLGRSEAARELGQQIDAEVARISAATRARLAGRAPWVYYEVDAGPYAAGPASYIGELLERLGARNIIAPDLGPYPKINPEYVVRRDPQVIFIAPAEVTRLAQRPGWDAIRAVREQRVCSFPPDVRDTIVRPGPRVAEGLAALAACLERVAP